MNRAEYDHRLKDIAQIEITLRHLKKQLWSKNKHPLVGEIFKSENNLTMKINRLLDEVREYVPTE